MSFLVVLLVLLVEKFSDWRPRLQRDGFWLARLRQAEASPRLNGAPWLALLALVLLPVLLLGLLLLALEPLAYGWLSLPLHLLVLLYSLGRGHAKTELGAFRDAWRRGDEEAAALAAERDAGLRAEDPPSLLQAAQAHLLWRSYEGFFAVVFWYLLLGPMAALAYRLLALCMEHAQLAGLRERAEQLRHAFDWLPVRLLLASFALVGNFVAVNRALLHQLLSWDVPAPRLLADAGPLAADLPAAIDGEAGIARLDGLAALLVRTRMLWYAVIAIWTILA
ncbi:regulatory signaling modulator protein AmpE [Pseudomonas lopnurensis]|uniref:regulatory signaling modulator protein AmpE n=1 Tax=Pseudomonas lopnurensis TaxID=1477517 RepID=UPI0018793D82|nr:regulatory signaling modulator protein AmpE [Pseudomonas lopnurensis]MBE7376960.1 regulatory signaling modulator protein AmpE [Pseudomonas lopnurensis]